ncbi:MAG: response regulator [Chthoniobacter sp.]|nr:response regulator [Chthoniobacter sp.]
MRSQTPSLFIWRSLALPFCVLVGCLVLIITIAHSLPQTPSGVWQQWVLISLAVAAMVAAVATCVRAGRSMAAPVAHLVEVAMAVKNGRAKHRASGKVAGEFRPLAEALNQMIEARQRAEEKLKLAQESLELKVHARTVELWRANKALQEQMEQRAKAERELQQAQKMDALGKFAGSIAHDFNNLLTVILGGTECAMLHLRPDHESMQFLRTIWKAGESAAALTKPLLTFSRNEVREVEALNLNECVEETATLVRRLIGVNIEVKLNLDPELPQIVGNANQFQQVLVNLAVNARDAMNGMGTLTMATHRATVDPETQLRHEATAAEWIELKVSDSGCGMDAETKARIFEPFFTTKPAGRGTGLGLATVFGIVKQAGGFLEVESEVGVGTSFCLFIPVTEKPVQAAAPEATAAPATPGSGGETILLVEDEDEIRELATLMLEGRGYHVISAPDAEEAIMLAEQHGLGIQALITDVVMPRINGVQLAEILAKKMPHLRILFVSGHCRESVSPETLAANRAEYLQKPYRSESLIAAVQQVLAG